MKKHYRLWYPGDFEAYHSVLVHMRREDHGTPAASMWKLVSHEPYVRFRKTASSETEREITVISEGEGDARIDEVRYPLNTKITVPAGEHTLLVSVCDMGHLPTVFIDDEVFGTDGTWTVSNGTSDFLPVGFSEAYTSGDSDPCVFPFEYEDIYPKTAERVPGGMLYDFGKEYFGPVFLGGCGKDDEILVSYGESRPEALDPERTFTKESVKGKTSYRLKSRAFRYIFVKSADADKISLGARYEYLPLEDRGSFSCGDSLIDRVWQTCAYTFHLCSREFFFDGIKRDRWVWSGDAYQSFLTNNYLFFDRDITKRTLLCLLGKEPYEQHINTITDYTLYLIIAFWDYYYATGDRDFLTLVWKRIKALWSFAACRLDENGQMVGIGKDWVFIDWSDMDKDGPQCAEQILLWKTEKSLASLAEVMKEDPSPYLKKADKLRKFIEENYYSEEKKAYIDTYASGRNNVTRHANIFAILYDFADEERQRELTKSVLNNDSIIQITTPYFKFFELCARCKTGDVVSAQETIRSYWGGMVKEGATTIWEQFDPNAQGEEHLAMYGEKFGCSLCHAWGGGPIYILGRYCLGVYPTSEGYGTFAVEPNPGEYSELHGTVPLPNGNVSVDLKNGTLTVFSDCEGGEVVFGGKRLALPKGKTLTLDFE